MEITQGMTRQQAVAIVRAKIEEELKALALEDLQDILEVLIIRRSFSSAHMREP